MKATTSTIRFRPPQTWRRVLEIAATLLGVGAGLVVLILSIRLIVAGIVGGPTPLVALGLALGGFAAALRYGAVALPAAVACTAIIEGLRRIGVFWYAAATPTVVSGLLIGWICRCASRKGADQVPRPSLLLLLLAGWIAVSLARTLPSTAWLDSRFWSQPQFGYGDALYPVEAAQGWMGIVALFYGWRRLGGCGTEAIGLEVMLCVTLSMVTLVAFQIVAEMPPLYPSDVGRGSPTLPCGDIHALGTLAAWLAITALAMATVANTRRSWWITMSSLAFAVCLLSWSRAAWLGSFVGIACLAWQKMPRRWLIAVSALTLSLLMLANFAPQKMLPSSGYAARFTNLARLRDAPSRDQDRIFLWQKAFNMIANAPVSGHGVGSFYRKSPDFAAEKDPLAATPNFAHNLILQAGAEMGLVMLLLVFGLAISLGCERRSNSATWSQQERVWMDASWLGLVALGTTQLTANALAIYPDQQLYAVWALVTALPACSPRAQPYSQT